MSKFRWEDKTNMQRKGNKLEGELYWIELAQNWDKRRANETSGSTKCRNFLTG